MKIALIRSHGIKYSGGQDFWVELSRYVCVCVCVHACMHVVRIRNATHFAKTCLNALNDFILLRAIFIGIVDFLTFFSFLIDIRRTMSLAPPGEVIKTNSWYFTEERIRQNT